MTPTIWQIAAGEPGRYFTSIFLDYDLMFLGPGDPGNIMESLEYSKLNLSGQKLEALKKFANPNEVRVGDIILLRETYKVVAIGIVADDIYHWNSCLDDVYGWDLQHTRRVLWQSHLDVELEKIQLIEKVFSHRKQIPMFTKVDDLKVLEKVDYMFKQFKQRNLKKTLSGVNRPLDLSELREELFNEGLAFDQVRHLTNVIEDQRRLVEWYYSNGKLSNRPTEHEIVAFMIIPLLTALGWSKQLLAVEWNKIDLAGFSNVPSSHDNCIFICEAKSLGTAMGEIYNQAEGYANNLQLKNCQKIITSDGARIFIYEKSGDNWSKEPSGYINLMKIRRQHLVHSKADAVKTLMALTPAGIQRKIK